MLGSKTEIAPGVWKLRVYAKAAGVKTHLHALRHFSATQLIAGGHAVRTVAGRLGHADASVALRSTATCCLSGTAKRRRRSDAPRRC